jgi:hypothetical protein
MTDLSLNETARRHGVSKAGLSQAVHADRPIKGMALHRFAVLHDGEVQGFEFPDWYCMPTEEEEEEETVFMTMEEICQEHSAFDIFKLETALRNGWPVDGFPVYDWVCYDDLGKWDGFEVPKSADLDGPHRQNVPSTNEGAESGEKHAAQGGSPNEIALSGDDDSLDEEEIAENGQKATQSLLALACAIGFSALTNG